MPPPGHVLAVDVGSSALRVSAVSLAGEMLVTERIPSRPEIAGPRAVLDAAGLWSDLCGLVASVCARAGVPLAIGVACQLGLVLADESFSPVVPAVLWQDRRASAEADELRQMLGDRAADIAGRTVAPEQTAARWRWFVAHEPSVRARTRWILGLKDYLVARLTGEVTTDATSASYSLLFDVRYRAWSPVLLEATETPIESLPAVRDAAECGGALLADLARPLGLPAGIPVAVGGPDGSVAALGSGAVRPGITVDVAGTTDTIVHVGDRPVVDPSHRAVTNAYLLPGLWTVGGPTGMSGGAIAWLCEILGFASVDDCYAALGSRSAALAPGADGVRFRTGLTGERFPTWASAASGSLSGLRPEHTSAHLLRAAEEGAAFAVREGLEALEALELPVPEIRICGGVAGQQESMALRAAAVGRPAVGVAQHEATTIGAAMLASLCCGAYPSADAAAAAMVRLGPRIAPDPTAVASYDIAYERWRGGATDGGPAGGAFRDV